jgi:hypothetical protein
VGGAGGKERPARKTDNFTAICGLISYKVQEPRLLNSL